MTDANNHLGRIGYLRRERTRTHAEYLASIMRAADDDRSPAGAARVAGERAALDRIDREIEALSHLNPTGLERRNTKELTL